MKPTLAFVCGMVIGGFLVALLVRSPPPRDAARPDEWRERAETAEHDLAEARQRLEGLSGRLQELSTRFDALTARFEALTAASTPSAPAP